VPLSSVSSHSKMDRASLSHTAMGSSNYGSGTDPSVAGLVYVAAHMLDAGENEADDGKRFPSDLSKSGAIKENDRWFHLP
jgi:hypothetical protein